MKLTDKQKDFCKEYIKDLNATQAAIRAGYSKNGARVTGHRLLTNPNIEAQIAKKQKKAADAAEVTAADVLRELTRLAFSKITDYVSFSKRGVVLKDSADLNEGQVAAIAEVSETTTRTKKGRQYKTRKFRLHSKTTALQMLGQHLDLFAEKDQAAVINVHIHDH